MSKHITQYTAFLKAIFASIAMIITLASCEDDIIYTPAEIPDGEVELRGEVIFKPLVPAEVKTRAEAPEGEKYKGIKSLYVFFFNSDENKTLNTQYSGLVPASELTVSLPEGSHGHASFKKKVKAGRYYIFAVANISSAQSAALANVKTIEELRNFKLTWDDNISDDLEMFGVFKPSNPNGNSTPDDNEDFEPDQLLTISRPTNTIHAWVRRAASKVTVSFDGRNLKDNVTVYIKKAVLKDVAAEAFLGAESKVSKENGIELVKPENQSKYCITYGNLSITNKSNADDFKDLHFDDAKALPCYENMQGVSSVDSIKHQDRNNDGIIDSEPSKDGFPNGTYLEVEGEYVADRPEYKSKGTIIYRFMLGKNADNDFNLMRNHHYQITMCFKGYGNDVDWHIEYTENYLDATKPEDVNYKGEFFVPSTDYGNIFNAGHSFGKENVITVTSFHTNGGKSNVWVEPTVTYTDYTYDAKNNAWIKGEETEASSWLKLTKKEEKDSINWNYTYEAPSGETYTPSFSTKSVSPSPYNLSNHEGKDAVENTANSYMIGAPGNYKFPLVYGNGFTGGTGDDISKYTNDHTLNHRGDKINAAYIKENGIDISKLKVKLLWQDAENLIQNLDYDPALFGSHGGITFSINSPMKEGNAVIALIDENMPTDAFDDYVFHQRRFLWKKESQPDGSTKSIYLYVYGENPIGSTKAVWSWHIWVTPFASAECEENITILNHEDQKFDVMPVNLGWCSGGKEIRYYKRRKCDITFKVGDKSIVRTIEQYPHFLLPRGDHPFYQWGRKDPFVGSSTPSGNKQRWVNFGNKVNGFCDIYNEYNPPRIYPEPESFENNAQRRHTEDCIPTLVRNPDQWHNAPREPIDPTDFTQGFYSTNKAPSDLWGSGNVKTVYDPCPPGYQIGNIKTFTGFTVTGGNERMSEKVNWYDAAVENMLQDYYKGEVIEQQVMDFYTDPRKIQSVTFPISGYRDYDQYGNVYDYPQTGYVWLSEASKNPNAYFFKYGRLSSAGGWAGGIFPAEVFYNTDGFGVRPVKTK